MDNEGNTISESLKDSIIKNLEKSQNELQIEKGVKELGDRLGISSESAKKLSELKTITNISILKDELSKIDVDNSKFDETVEQNEIFQKIQEIQKLQIEELKLKSKIEIASLKKGIEKIDNYKINTNTYTIADKLFSKEFLNKAENPENILQNLAGAGIGSIESIYSIGNYSKDLLIGLVKTPIDLYKIFTGKAEIDSIKNI